MFAETSDEVVGRLLETSIVELCKATLPMDPDGIEIDALICISKLPSSKEKSFILKIHEKILPTGAAKNTPRTPEEESKLPPSDSAAQAKRANKRKNAHPVSTLQMKMGMFNDLQGSESGERPLTKASQIEPENTTVVVKTEPQDDLDISQAQDTTSAPALQDSYVIMKPERLQASVLGSLNGRGLGGGVSWMCKLCFRHFDSEDLLRSHMLLHNHNALNQHARSQSALDCNKCGRTFTSSTALDFHMKTHALSDAPQNVTIAGSKQLNMRCTECPRYFKNRSSLVEHMRKEHGFFSYTCYTCDCIFRTFESFKSHRLTSHAQVNQCRCEKCDIYFTFTEIKEHDKECRQSLFTQDYPPLVSADVLDASNGKTGSMHSPSEPTQGESEDENSSTGPSLSNQHGWADVSGKDGATSAIKVSPTHGKHGACGRPKSYARDEPCCGPYRCQICFSVFDQFEAYETHNHEMHSRYVCAYCATSFATKRNLQRHARRHTGVRPYSCDDCTMTFTRDDDLKKHCARFFHRGRSSASRIVVPTLPGGSEAIADLSAELSADTTAPEIHEESMDFEDLSSKVAALDENGKVYYREMELSPAGSASDSAATEPLAEPSDISQQEVASPQASNRSENPTANSDVSPRFTRLSAMLEIQQGDSA